MKSTNLINTFSRRVFILSAVLFLASFSSVYGQDVCSQGTGLPPFLSAGAAPNMLILLDNSGSMLDMAYQDKVNDSFCFDDTYLLDETSGAHDPTKSYAGNFKADKWYIWNDVAPSTSSADITNWTKDKCYDPGDIILDNSRFWTAVCDAPEATCGGTGCKATGASFFADNKDGGLVWDTFYFAQEWVKGKYGINDIVEYQGQLYRCQKTVVVTDAAANLSPLENTNNWEEIPYTWLPEVEYNTGAIVSYEGMVFEANGNCSNPFKSSVTGLLDDRRTNEAGPLCWNRIDEGFFAEYAGALDTPCGDIGTPSYIHSYNDKYNNPVNDLAITLINAAGTTVGDTEILDNDDTNDPTNVTCFAARGNFLNWAMASKFDIQKQILTGGKFYAGYENKYVDPVSGDYIIDTRPDFISPAATADLDDDRLVSENRGCSGSGFIKQIELKAASAPDDAIMLTFRVRGTNEDDWIDTTDDMTRFEIMAVTEGGFNNDACQSVVQTAINGDPLQSDSINLTNCLSGSASDERAALNLSLQYCEKFRSGGARDLTALINKCEDVYDTTPPATIAPEQGSYPCYGVFDENTPYQDRQGFMGSCWNLTVDPGCIQKKCPAGTASGDFYETPAGSKNWYKCADDGFEYECNGNFSKGNPKTPPSCSGSWDPIIIQDPLSLAICPAVPTFSTGWSNDINGIPGPDGFLGAPTKCDIGAPLTEGVDCQCIVDSMKDYCSDLAVPEVIDPSDLASSTLDFLGLPSSLIDSGLASQLGDSPLAVYKGYTKYLLPDGSDGLTDQHTDAKERPDGPRGIFYDYATDLRIGAMAFKPNGSKYECEELTKTCTVDSSTKEFDACLTGGAYDPAKFVDQTSVCHYCTIRQPVIKFCPTIDSDGAKVIARVFEPLLMDDVNNTPEDPFDDLEVWTHHNDLNAAVNKTRATSWTPLAEAMYTAFGYYGQRLDRCLELDPADSTKCLDFGLETDDDPVQYWCQENNIAIITEGASTADINDVVAQFAATTAKDTDTYTEQGACTNGLDGSTYLDDLTYYGATGAKSDIFAFPKINATDTEEKRNIRTHIITSGSLGTYTAGDECTPATLMEDAAKQGNGSFLKGEDPSALQNNIDSIISDILSRASAGSAASVISSSRSGSGAVYQAIFWPELTSSSYDDTKTPIEQNGYTARWVGDVHALFLDSNGFLYEDTNQDGMLNPSTDLNHNGALDTNEIDADNDNAPDGDDYRVIFYFSTGNANRSRACMNITEFMSTGTCPDDPNPLDTTHPACVPGTAATSDDCRELQDISYLWSAAKWLWGVEMGNATSPHYDVNRTSYLPGPSGTFENRRHILTWQDLNNNGIADESTKGWLPFTAAALIPATPLDVTEDPASTVTFFGANSKRGAVVDDFAINSLDDIKNFVAINNAASVDNQEDAVKALINWVRGWDYSNEDVNINATDLIDVADTGEDINGDGVVMKGLRSRQFPIIANPATSQNTKDVTWRLGDIIHSTPTLVSRPAEAYHFIYKDPSYAIFANRYAHRRQVVYFGANDGMLHAINAGFYEEGINKFWKGRKSEAQYQIDKNEIPNDPTNDTYFTDNGPPLGAELWAYVPYNLHPHLKCMADPDYAHKYYVDQRPKIFDVQIFQDDCTYGTSIDCSTATHPGGWGTILVGSMRFGGVPVNASDLNGMDSMAPDSDERRFGSAYFILDISDPEQEPTLLGEMTMVTDVDGSGNGETADLQYSVPTSSLAIMRNDDDSTNWYLIMGSGPERLDGTNSTRGKLGILPLDWLVGSTGGWAESNGVKSPRAPLAANRKPFRIPNGQPGTSTAEGAKSGEPDAGIYRIPGTMPSSVSDLVTVDFDIEVSAGTHGAWYRSDAMYFGTIDGNYWGGTSSKPIWDGGGRLFRLVTKSVDGSGTELATIPQDWNNTSTYAGDKFADFSSLYGGTNLLKDGTDISTWTHGFNMLIDAKAPISSAPAIGWDGYSFWIYFGTGRFYDKKDKPDDLPNYWFGVREPWDTNYTCSSNSLRRLSWDTINWDVKTHNITHLLPTAAPGNRGLIQTDNMIVAEYASSVFGVPYLKCNLLSPSDCFPWTGNPMTDKNGVTDVVYTFNELKNYIVGQSCSTGIDGWYRKTHEARERHLGQAALLGGLVTYTSYQPYSDVCLAEGRSSLYGVHYQTGTAWYENVFGTDNINGDTYVKAKISLGRGLSTTPSLHVGSGDNAATAFIQTSTGEIIEIGQENLPLKNVKSGRGSWSDEN